MLTLAGVAIVKEQSISICTFFLYKCCNDDDDDDDDMKF